MPTLPLTILIGPENDEEVVLYEGEVIARVTAFTLDTGPILTTHFTCANCFPRKSGHSPPKPLSSYPLRIYADDDIKNLHISYLGRPIGHLSNVHVHLSATAKRIIRFTSYNPLPEELRQALLDLGVELIVQPLPPTPEDEETENAHV